MSNDKTILTGDVQAAIEAGSAIAALQSISPDKLAFDGALPMAVVPAGYKLEALEEHLPVPLRKRGRTTLNDMASFIAVVNDQKKDETRLYSTVNPPTFQAVFNDHAAIAGWRDTWRSTTRPCRWNGRPGWATAARARPSPTSPSSSKRTCRTSPSPTAPTCSRCRARWRQRRR